MTAPISGSPAGGSLASKSVSATPCTVNRRKMVPASTSRIAPLALDSVGFLGSRFARPECVLCTRAGDAFASDRRGGVSHIMPDGDHRIYIGATLDLSGPLHPNGIALDRDRSFLIAHLVDEEGGLWITCILSNRLIRIDVGGTSVTLL